MKSEVWNLEDDNETQDMTLYGQWDMKPGIWKLQSELCYGKIWQWDMAPELHSLGSERWHHDGIWNLKSDMWDMKPEIRIMTSVIRNMKSKIRKDYYLNSEIIWNSMHQPMVYKTPN